LWVRRGASLHNAEIIVRRGYFRLSAVYGCTGCVFGGCGSRGGYDKGEPGGPPYILYIIYQSQNYFPARTLGSLGALGFLDSLLLNSSKSSPIKV